jgi:histidinol-phosphate/aromatic aminotransferase/cobyric acid decarboxylase-like protein
MAALPAGDHGGDGAAVARWLGVPVSEIVDLSASLNPCAPDPAPVVARVVDAVRRYPDPSTGTALLAAAIGIEADRLVLTNGGAEAIALVAALEPEGAVASPEFSLYARHLTTLTDDPAARWRSNPSSPLGCLAGRADTARVWDEAFWPLATGTWTRGDDGAWRLGSLTKLWACPGLRLGYAIAPDAATAALLRRRQPQWAVNGLALAAIEPLLSHTDLPAWAAATLQQRRHLVGLLVAHGLTVTDTDACWVLVHRPGLRAELLPYGVVVRDCTSFGLPGVHRIAVPTEEQLDRLMDAVAAVTRARPTDQSARPST